MNRRPPRSTRTDPLFPYTTLFRSHQRSPAGSPAGLAPPDGSSQKIVQTPWFAPPHRVDTARYKHRPSRLPITEKGRWQKPPAISLSLNARAGDAKSMLTSARLRSEEHTSELQSLMRISYAVFCLKKKKTKNKDNTTINQT